MPASTTDLISLWAVCGAATSNGQQMRHGRVIWHTKAPGHDPTCDARIGLILVPPDAVTQPVLAQVPIAQLGSFCYVHYDAAVTETVWACGDTRLRGGWGSYFQCGGEDCPASSTPPAGKMKRK